MNLANLPTANSNRSYFDNSRSWGVEVVLLIAVIVLGYFFIVAPKRNVLATERDELKTVQEKKSALSSDSQTLQNLVGQLKSSSKQVEMLDEALPLNGKVTSLEMMLNQLVRQSGMTVGTVAVSNTGQEIVSGNLDLLKNYYGQERSVKTVQATVDVSGTIDQFQGLLKKFELSGRILDVTSLNIGTTKDGLMDFKILLQSYVYE